MAISITDTEPILNFAKEDLDKIPNVMPLLPVRDIVVFADMLFPLFVGRDRAVNAVDEAMSKDNFIFLATQKDSETDDPKADAIFTMGTVCKILRVVKIPNGQTKLLVRGIVRAQIVKYIKRKKSFTVQIQIIKEPKVSAEDLASQALMRTVRQNCEKILRINGEMNGEIAILFAKITEPGKLADIVAANLRLRNEECQMILEIVDPIKRLKKVNQFLSKEVALSKMQAKIQANVRDEITKNQRDYFLKEQVRAINKELGETDEKYEEIIEYEKKIKKAEMPKHALEEAESQLIRLEQMHPEASEASMVRTYLDWLVDLPWSKSTKDNYDIKKSKTVLDKHHYGLTDIKDRIIEYLSVKKLNPEMRGPILCFVGPPGVGKTSLGKAIAKSMKRKFVRISLGGIKDEAEIRGHRRTYIGSLPGRVLQSLKQCKSANPVFMMDEIDKIGADFRGDPASALLEALDPEQNSEFSDHYINLNFDLSKVMFILTANITDTIPPALLDRMEIIELSGYTEEEKTAIAKRHLIPRQKENNGLKRRKITIIPKAISAMLNGYTSEAGVRNLERQLNKIFRKIARKTVEGKKGPFSITEKNLKDYLGIAKYYPEMDKEESQIGVATGLAWTQTGGEVLYVEVSLIPGKNELITTGQLGDVMEESAKAAVSYARSNLKAYGLKKDFFENTDVHIHVPAGATPKDGPSAGIAMATALISAMSLKPISKDVAMTGEITLRGRVLPIGGLKEKTLGGLRAGIKKIIIPKKNEQEISKLPDNVKEKIRFISVKNMDEVLKAAFDV
ncbi:MAG: endopeptidase La [Deltaproteobacteria bacterium]|nr:endopeptidase La [Deltaproteobacteria bacterium]